MNALQKRKHRNWWTGRKVLVAWVALGILTPTLWVCYQIFRPRIPLIVSYETTRITSPLTEDGYVDYAGHVLETYPHSVESLPESKWLLPELDRTRHVDLACPIIPAKADDQQDSDRYWAHFKAYHQRIRSAPISRFSHPSTAFEIAANRDWYETLELALQHPVAITRIGLPFGALERTLDFASTEGPDLGTLSYHVNLHLGEGQQGEAFRVIDCLRQSVERRLKVPFCAHPYYDVPNEAIACRCAMTAAMVAPRFSDDHWEWIEALPTERPTAEMIKVIDIKIRFYCLDFLQLLHRQPEEDWRSWDDFNQFAAKRIYEPVDWNLIARDLNHCIDAVIDGLPAADTFPRQNELLFKHLRALAESEWAETDQGEGFPDFLSSYFDWYFLTANRLAVLYRHTHLVFELSEWKRIHGHFPNQLTELPIRSERVKTAFVDPFTGQTMKYQRTEKGFRLYSVGSNGEDDFGCESPDKIPPSFLTAERTDSRTGRHADDMMFEWPPASYRAGRNLR